MISRWPVRGGPVVVGNVLYFGAGIWPTEGIFIYAIDPASGKVLWCNDSSGGIEMDQPHPTARAQSGISAQGYLAACGDALLVPTGRAVPVVLDRVGGKLLYFQLQQNTQVGESDVVAVDKHFFNGGEMFGTMLAFSAEHNVLLMSYQPVHQASRLSEWGDRMAGIRPSDGSRLWDIKTAYVSRPILNGRTVYAQSGAWDLLSGQQLPFTFTRSYGSGIPVGSKHLLVFRSATLGYRDLTGATGSTQNYGGIRLGCWINAIPAGGLVLMADAASWCTCSYLNQATCTLQPSE